MGATTREAPQDVTTYSSTGTHDMLMVRAKAAKAGACTPRELRDMAATDVPGLIGEIRRLQRLLDAAGVVS